MKVVRYSEEELFRFAFSNIRNLELLEVLIRDYGLDVNWRSSNFYDTLLYQAFKHNIATAKFLISKGACVNASLGGYPSDEHSHGKSSLLDIVNDFVSLKEVGGPNWLRQFGAISFENLPDNKKEQIIATIDFTKQASSTKYLTRSLEQVKISQASLSQKSCKELNKFIENCRLEEISITSKR
jgi:hypothetical protein